MKFNPLSLKEYKEGLYLLAIFAFGLLAYSSILMIGIPSKLNLLLSAPDSLFLCLCLLVFLYFVYRPSGWIGTLTSFSGTLILFAVQLSAVWRSAVDGNGYFSLGGLLPMSDAQAYYQGALNLLEGSYLSGVATYRPLAHGVLATLLAVTQQNLQVSVSILVLITAIACFFLAREIQQSHGTITGIVVLSLIFVFYRTWIGTVMTENVGLALGTIGLAILWRGAIQSRINLCLLGILLLTLGLNARAGAFFLLPALVLWGTCSFKGTSRFSAQFLIGGFSAVLLGFIINSIVLKVTTSHDTVGNSNFSYILYGLIVGGKWDTVLKNHPELSNLSVTEQSQKVYELVLEAFRADPLALVRGFFRAWRMFFFNHFIFSFAKSIKVKAILEILSVIGIVNCYQQRKTPIGSLIIAGLIGIFLSVPFVPPWDGGIRTYGATIAFFTILPALSLHFIAQKFNWQQLLKVPSKKDFPPVLWLFGIALALLTFVGPLVVNFLKQPPQFSEISCPEATEVIYFRNNPGSSINIVSDQTIQKTNVPNVRFSDFKTGLYQLDLIYHKFAEELSQLAPNTRLFQKINLKNGQNIKLIVHSELLPQKIGILAACVQKKVIPVIEGNARQIAHETIYYAQSIQLVSR